MLIAPCSAPAGVAGAITPTTTTGTRVDVPNAFGAFAVGARDEVGAKVPESNLADAFKEDESWVRLGTWTLHSFSARW
jgi:hypothetical protein